MYQLSFTRIAVCAISMFAVLQFSLVPEAAAQHSAQSGVRDKGSVAQAKFVEPLTNRDLEQFRGYVSEEIGPGWSIEGKHLVYAGSLGDDIMTKETYEDFELQVEWQIQEGGNSGIMFRVTTGDEAPYMSGPEFQILDDEADSDGSSELNSAGALYGLYPAAGKKLRGAGKWNKSRIIVEGNKITHHLNGTKVVEAEIGSDDWNKRLAESKFKDWEKFAKASSGHICFQDHGDPVRFRNIRIKSLGEMVESTEVSDPRSKSGKGRSKTRGKDRDSGDGVRDRRGKKGSKLGGEGEGLGDGGKKGGGSNLSDDKIDK
jgi:hypothetical protein